MNPKLAEARGYKVENRNICENKTDVDFIKCFEEITFSTREIIPQYIVGNGMDFDYVSTTDNDYENLKVKDFFDTYGGLAKYLEINNYTMMSQDSSSTVAVELNENLTYEIYFMDKKMQYVFGSPDIIPRPVLTLKQSQGWVFIYLKAIRHEKLNQPNQPCNPSPGYDFTFCLEKNIIKTVGCQPPWRRFIVENQSFCDNLSMLDKYGNQMDEFFNTGKIDLFEKTECLIPCFFMEYRVSFSH